MMLALILLNVLANAAAQLMLKKGVISLDTLSLADGNPVLKIFEIVFQPFVFLGLVTLIISMALHLYILSKVEISFAYPFLSLAYVAVAVAAWLWFDENLNALRIMGIALICVGTVLIAQGGGALDARADPRADPMADPGADPAASTVETRD